MTNNFRVIESVGADRDRLRSRNPTLDPLAPLQGYGPDVEQHERLIGVIDQLEVAESQVAVKLPGPCFMVRVAGVANVDIGPADRDPGDVQGRQDLFVDAVFPTDVVADGKQPDVVDDGIAAGPIGLGVTRAAHHEPGRRQFARSDLIEQPLELCPLGRLDHVIGIEPEGVIAGGMLESIVPRRGEAIDPGEFEDLGPERAGDRNRVVGAAGVDDDNLVEHAGHRGQAMWKIFVLVLYDHRQGDAGPLVR